MFEFMFMDTAMYIRLYVQVPMLLLGCCNPAGEGSQYNGLYYTASELESIVREGQLHGVDVKTEHAGNAIGKVVSSFLDDQGTLQCVMQVDESTVEGALVSGFVRDGIAADLSLGYTVDIRHSQHTNALKAGSKNLLEVSIVRRGARDGCHISVYEDKTGVVYVKDKTDPWSGFDMN